MDLILSFDIGTSGTKTSLVKTDGTILDSATSPYQTWFPESGWAEQETDDWWKGVCRNTGILIEKHPAAAGDIIAIGVSGHMIGCVPVDASGKALNKALIHSDSRSVKQFDIVKKSIGLKELYCITGNIPDPRSSLCKVLWFMQEKPDIYKKTAKFLQSKDYIVSRLTGDIDTTDFSDASHAQLIDICKKEYDKALLKELGLDYGKLPSLKRGTEIAGHLTRECAEILGVTAGIPVSVGGGDGACASVGAGVINPGDIYCCLGTTAWIAYSTSEPVFDSALRLFNILSIDGDTCGVHGTVQSAGRSMEWVAELFDEPDKKEFDKLAASAAYGSEGLIFLPYLEGERSPIFDTKARGVFFGLCPTHSKKHMMRSVLEGVALALRNVLDVFRETADIGSMRIIGGGANSIVWRDIIANVCNVTLDTLSVPSGDATSLGAAIAAGVCAGVYTNVSEGVKSIGIKSREFPKEEIVKFYEKEYQIYKSLYPQLKQAYTELSHIRHEINK